MGQLETKYGVLKGAQNIQYYPDGTINQCTLTEPNRVVTGCGTFVPQYTDDGFRRKRVKPVTFHKNGNIKNLPLQDKAFIKTTVGVISAELITWYANGSMRRIFPLNGSLTGFWTEDDEYELAEPIEIDFPFGKIKQKLIGIQFYECGNLKNITLWPKDRVTITTPFGNAEVRIGLSVYPDGTLMAFEPAKPLVVQTPIGRIQAFNPKAMAIHSDNLSLRLTKSGEIENIVTSMDMVTVVDKSGRKYSFKPQFRPSLFNLQGNELFPLRIHFNNSGICFNNNPEHEFDITECNITVSPVFNQKAGECSLCDNCSNCR